MKTLNVNNRKECDLLARICDRIRWDKRVSLADLDVVVQGSVATVSGSVDTSFKKSAALEVIANTEGVWAVDDRIIVPADFYRSDEELDKILQLQFAELVKVCGEHIEWTVSDGLVKLSGEVFRPRLKAMAASVVWELSGVRDVVNEIEICDPPHQVSRVDSQRFKEVT